MEKKRIFQLRSDKLFTENMMNNKLYRAVSCQMYSNGSLKMKGEKKESDT